MNTEFENQLQRQPLRQPPSEWRSQILGAASLSAPRSLYAPLIDWVSGWLWPHPRAWAGLGAAWVLILLLHFTSSDEAQLIGSSSPITVQSLARMQQQTLGMAELLGSVDIYNPPAAVVSPSAPRSEGPRKQRMG
ncbi:MAG TPA: hypothetical protein VGO67_18065 [Verrucomicrobiae bacterium]|jgi:hypothetical protein